MARPQQSQALNAPALDNGVSLRVEKNPGVISSGICTCLLFHSQRARPAILWMTTKGCVDERRSAGKQLDLNEFWVFSAAMPLLGCDSAFVARIKCYGALWYAIFVAGSAFNFAVAVFCNCGAKMIWDELWESQPQKAVPRQLIIYHFNFFEYDFQFDYC